MSFINHILFLPYEGRSTMGIFDEKEAIYEQMKLLIEERREITKKYYDLKQKLEAFEDKPSNSHFKNNCRKKNDWSMDIEHQKYILSKKEKNFSIVSYQDIALKIASFLKEAGQPVQTRQIFQFILERYNYNLTYSNFVSNILPRIHRDSNINVEKAYRGYWQYRLK